MKKTGITFLVGIVLIIIGVIFGGLHHMDHLSNLSSYRWRRQQESDISYNTTHASSLDIRVHFANIQFYQTQEEDIRVEASHIYNGFQVYEKNNTLIIEQPHYLWWNDADTSFISVYLPETMVLDEVQIDMSAGKTTLSDLKARQVDIDTIAGELNLDDVKCETMDIDASMGQTIINHLQINKRLDIDLGLGDIYILIDDYEEAYNYSVDVGLGNVSIGHQQFSGIVDRLNQSVFSAPMLDIDCGLGNVDIEMEEN